MRENVGSAIKMNNSTFSLSSMVSTLSLLVFLVLLFLVVKVGWSKIAGQRKTISDLRTRQLILIEKKEKLRRASKDLVPLFFEASSSFLPLKTSILPVLSSMKGFLVEYMLPVESFTVSIASSEVGDGGSIAGDSIRLELLGDFEQISVFLKRIEEVVPLMAVKKVSFASEGDVVSADVEIQSFWSPYSESLPVGIASPLPEFLDNEKNVLERLSKMERIGLTQDLSPSGPYERANPFLEQ